MWLRYSNNYARGLWLAIGYYNPGCSDGSNWGKRGWYRIEPGQSAIVLWTTNAHSTFFAEADDGVFWGGGPFNTNVPSQAFDWCWNTASSQGQIVGMRLVTVSNPWAPWIGTVNLS